MILNIFCKIFYLKKKSYALVAPNSVFGLEVVNW